MIIDQIIWFFGTFTPEEWWAIGRAAAEQLIRFVLASSSRERPAASLQR